MRDLLSQEGVVRRLPEDVRSQVRVVVERSCASTNDDAALIGRESPDQVCFVVADEQTRGRGSRGRSFASADNGVYMSAVLPVRLLKPSFASSTTAEGQKAIKDRNPIGGTAEKHENHLLNWEGGKDEHRLAPLPVEVTCRAAVAVSRAVDRVLSINEKCQVKWVNDVYLHNRKVCGILTEAHLDAGFLVLGMGVDVYAPEDGYPPDVAERAGFLFSSRTYGTKDGVAAAVIEEVMRALFCEGRAKALEEYRRRLMFLGEDVVVRPSTDKAYPARALDVNEDYTLDVLDARGVKRVLRSGEVSVRACR